MQSYVIKASVRKYQVRGISDLVQQGDWEVRIAVTDLSFTLGPNHQVV